MMNYKAMDFQSDSMKRVGETPYWGVWYKIASVAPGLQPTIAGGYVDMGPTGTAMWSMLKRCESQEAAEALAQAMEYDINNPS